MKDNEISFRTEGQFHVAVYRGDKRLGVLYWGTDKIWYFSVSQTASDKPATTLTINEMREIIGMMCTLDRTDNYGAKVDPSR